MKKQKDRKLTVKQKAFIKEKLDNPKISDTQAAVRAYSEPGKPIDRGSAAVIAFENMRKPSIISKLSEYNDMVESALLNTVRDWASEDAPRKREIALDSAKFIHDKVHGRATQKIETQSQVVSISIDMTKPAEVE